MMPIAIDVSQYTGQITSQQARGLMPVGVRRVIVSTHPRYMAQQMQVLADADIELEAYIYLYLRSDIVKAVTSAIRRFKDFPIRRLWLDAEDTGSHYNPVQVIDRLEKARAAADGIKTGIYTGRWWWVPYTKNSQSFSDLPLWTAQYDKMPVLDNVSSFGGWERPSMKQHTPDTRVGGIWCDINWYEENVPQPGDPYRFDGRDFSQGWEGSDTARLLAASLNGRVRGFKYVEWRGRTVPAVVILPE